MVDEFVAVTVEGTVTDLKVIGDKAYATVSVDDKTYHAVFNNDVLRLKVGDRASIHVTDGGAKVLGIMAP